MMDPEVESETLDDATYFRFFNEVGIINQLSSTRAERAMPHGLTMPQFSVLNHFMRGRPPASPLKLANAFQVTKGAMTNTLKHLEAKGFIAIKPHETDGRSKIVSITEAGREAHRDAQTSLTGYFSDFTAAFDAAELSAVLPLLEKVRQWLDDNRK